MAICVGEGSASFDAMSFGVPIGGLGEIVSAYKEAVSAKLTDAGKSWVNASASIYKWVSESDAIDYAKSVLKQVSMVWELDMVRPLLTVEQLQSAPPTMQRWVMAEPTIRGLFLDNRCEGYSESYVNVGGNRIGENHYDYRQAVTGLLMDTPEGWVADIFIEELRGDDDGLSLDEQIQIQRTWRTVRDAVLENKGDPTSLFGNDL